MDKTSILFKHTQLLKATWDFEETLAFTLKKNNKEFETIIRPLSKKENDTYNERTKQYAMICEIFMSQKVNAANTNVFNNIIQNKYKKDNDGKCLSFSSHVFDNMQYRVPPLKSMPTGFQELVQQVTKNLSEAKNDILKTIRWIYNIEGENNIMGISHIHWKMKDSPWHQLPDDFYAVVITVENTVSTENLNQEVRRVVESNATEPIYHSLFREAWHQRNQNRSSAIVIGISSLEIAVKQCISVHVQNTKWLMENVPSPPVKTLLEEYIPQIINDKSTKLSKNIIDDVKKGVDIRNKVAHVGKNIPDHKTTEKILTTIKNLLWLIDYWSGYEWALNYIDHDFKQECNL